MASVLKVKRSSVQGKAPTTNDLQTGELALNTRDGKLFSSDGSSVFEVGSNVATIDVGTLTIGNTNPYSFPSEDGSALQILQTDGSGQLTFVALEQAEGGGFTRGTLTSFPTGDYFEGGGTTETFVGSSGEAGSDAFGVSLATVYDCMDPNGRLVTEDLEALS